MPRLFTGLQIPEDITGEIARFRGGLPGARWIEPEDYHITLRFVGDVGLPLAREIDAGLNALDHQPLTISIVGLDYFGGKKPRAIIAKVHASAELTALQSAHERTIRRAGAEDDTRKFLPHVTIARLRNVQRLAVGDYLHARSIARTCGTIVTDRSPA